MVSARSTLPHRPFSIGRPCLGVSATVGKRTLFIEPRRRADVLIVANALMCWHSVCHASASSAAPSGEHLSSHGLSSCSMVASALLVSPRNLFALFFFATWFCVHSVAVQSQWHFFCLVPASRLFTRAKISLRLWRPDFACLPRVLLLACFLFALADSLLIGRGRANSLGLCLWECDVAHRRGCHQ